MAKLLMITGLGSAKDLAFGKKGAFYYMLEEFCKHWDRIDIICPRIMNNELRIMNLFNNVYIHISPWPLIFHPIWFIKKGLEIYKEQKFDLMTVQEFPPFYNGIGARLLSRKIKVPYILEIHHIPGYPRASNLKEKFYKILMRWFIRYDAKKSKAVRVVNQNQTSEFLIKSGVPKKKIISISSMYIDLNTFRPLNLEKEYDLIFVGRLVPNKRLDLFIDAVKNLGLKALIVGEGPLYKKIKLKIENCLPVGEAGKLKINLYGWANDQKKLAELINKSKLLLMTSDNEGGPRVVFEALACGVPVLATPVGLVPDFRNSITIVDWNIRDIVSKIKKLLADNQAYESMKIQGLSVVRQFDKKAAIKNYADKLKQLI